LRAAWECGEIEVVEKRYRPWEDRETVIILRLRGFEGESNDGHVNGDLDINGPRAFIRCRSCGYGLG